MIEVWLPAHRKLITWSSLLDPGKTQMHMDPVFVQWCADHNWTPKLDVGKVRPTDDGVAVEMCCVFEDHEHALAVLFKMRFGGT